MLDIKEVEEFLNSIGYKLIKFYRRGVRPYVFIEDQEGYKYDVQYSKYSLVNNHLRFDNYNKFSTENIRLWLKINKKSFYLNDGEEFINNNAEMLFTCVVCRDSFYMDWDHILHGNNGCPLCRGMRVGKYNTLQHLRPDLAKEWSDKNTFGPNEVVVHAHKSAWWICSVCNYEWETKIYARANGNGCPACGGKIVTSNNNLHSLFPIIASEWNYSKNKNKPTEVLSKSGNKVWWTCPQCGDSYYARISDRTQNGSGCPICAMSKGNRKISNCLNSFYVDFKHEFRFSECFDKHPLPFDFYLSDYNLCIEYHGIQHYENIDFFNAGGGFEGVQRRDQIKSDYCNNNGINLLVIPYWDYDNIEEIITNALQDIERSNNAQR